MICQSSEHELEMSLNYYHTKIEVTIYKINRVIDMFVC